MELLRNTLYNVTWRNVLIIGIKINQNNLPGSTETPLYEKKTNYLSSPMWVLLYSIICVLIKQHFYVSSKIIILSLLFLFHFCSVFLKEALSWKAPRLSRQMGYLQNKCEHFYFFYLILLKHFYKALKEISCQISDILW